MDKRTEVEREAETALKTRHHLPQTIFSAHLSHLSSAKASSSRQPSLTLTPKCLEGFLPLAPLPLSLYLSRDEIIWFWSL